MDGPLLPAQSDSDFWLDDTMRRVEARNVPSSDPWSGRVDPDDRPVRSPSPEPGCGVDPAVGIFRTQVAIARPPDLWIHWPLLGSDRICGGKVRLGGGAQTGGGAVDILDSPEDVSGTPSGRPMPVPEFPWSAMEPPHDSVGPSRRGRASLPVRVLSVIWALLPIATLGIAAPFTFTFAAIRLRSRAIGLCAGAYGAVASASLFLLGVGSDTSWEGNVGFSMGFVAGAVATGHSFAIRKRLLLPEGDEDAVIAHAHAQLRLRDKAREIVARDPRLAHELQIGRPDFPRRFDDGGLVDVNRVPPDYLAQLPGVDRSMAERIADVRDGIGGFSSVEDLSVTLGIHPHALDQAAGRMIFIR